MIRAGSESHTPSFQSLGITLFKSYKLFESGWHHSKPTGRGGEPWHTGPLEYDFMGYVHLRFTSSRMSATLIAYHMRYTSVVLFPCSAHTPHGCGWMCILHTWYVPASVYGERSPSFALVLWLHQGTVTSYVLSLVEKKHK